MSNENARHFIYEMVGTSFHSTYLPLGSNPLASLPSSPPPHTQWKNWWKSMVSHGYLDVHGLVHLAKDLQRVKEIIFLRRQRYSKTGMKWWKATYLPTYLHYYPHNGNGENLAFPVLSSPSFSFSSAIEDLVGSSKMPIRNLTSNFILFHYIKTIKINNNHIS